MESSHKRPAVQTSAVFGTTSHFNFQREFWNRIFRAFKEPHFPKSVTPKILKVWRWYFFSKTWKFYVHFKNAIKISQNVFGFLNNCVGTCCGNFSELWQEYMRSTVNVLKDGPNISDKTKRHDTQLALFDINGKIA